MGSLFDAIGDFIGDLIGSVWDAVTDFLSTVGEFVLDKIIEPIMSFLGFTDEDIYLTDVIAVKVFDEDLFEKTQIELSLDYMKNGNSALQYITNFSDTGDKQFGKYYRHGKWDYLDYLPSAQINAVSIDTNNVKQILENINNSEIAINDIVTMVPYAEDWCKYQLQELYGYKISEDYVIINNTYYKYNRNYYNSDNNTYVIVLSTIGDITNRLYRRTVVTISPNDDITDIKHTIIEEQTISLRSDIGSIINDTGFIQISSNDEIVNKGSVIASSNIELISEEHITNTITYKNISIPNHNNERQYVVKYIVKSINELKYWIYNPETNVYPELTTPVQKIIGFDMYPIVMIRNSFFNIEDYNKSEVNGVSRPPTVTKERYDDTQLMLSSIGVSLEDLTKSYSENPDIDKIQDAFFMLGISPSDNHPIVSKTLFEMFDFIYDRIPYVSGTSTYSASFKEDPYNAAIAWIPEYTTITNEVIGSIGDYTHTIRNVVTTVNEYTIQTVSLYDSNNKYKKKIEIYTLTELSSTYGSTLTETSNYSTKIVIDYDDKYKIGTTKTLSSSSNENAKDLILKKQITNTTVKTITIRNFTSFNIIRRGVSNGGVSLEADDENLVIPLPVPVVERLTLLDRTTLLGRSVHLLFYAFEHQHLEWYETEKFGKFLQFLTIAITVVVTIVSWGTATNATMTLSSILLGTLKTISIGVALQVALKMITTYVDSTFLKMALSVVAMIIAIYIGSGFDNLNALTAIQLSEIPVKAFDIYTNDLTSILQQDITNFTNKYSSRTDEYSNLIKELNSGLTASDITEITLNSTNDWFNNTGVSLSPSQFYSTAIDSYKNYDLLYSGLYDSSVHDFVSNKLTLGIIGD